MFRDDGRPYQRRPNNKPREISPEARQRMAEAGKKNFENRWYKTSEQALADRPPLNEKNAHTYVLLQMAGVPPRLALKSLKPSYYSRLSGDQRLTWRKDWDCSQMVVDAQDTLSGGNWETLTPEQREKAALDKHFSEMAFFLMANHFYTAWGDDLKKMTMAREALVERTQSNHDPNGAFAVMLRRLLHQSDSKKADIGMPQVYEPSSHTEH